MSSNRNALIVFMIVLTILAGAAFVTALLHEFL